MMEASVEVLAQLSAVLMNTYNPSQDIRLMAEEQLQQFLNTPGSAQVLLALIGQRDAVARDLRLAAVLIFKNTINDFWRTEEKLATAKQSGIIIKTRALALEERESAKGALLEIMLNETDNSMRKSVAEAVKKVSENDPPESTWSSLMPTLVQSMAGGGSILNVYNAVVCARGVMKRYEFSRETRRNTLDSMIQLVFPQLQSLLITLQSQQTIETAALIHVSLKVFFSATSYSLPRGPGIDVGFWFSVLAAVINKPLPEASEGLEPAGQPTTPEERRAWPWWKAKKWATKIASMFFPRYGNPKFSAEENEGFATYFRDNVALQLLGPMMNSLTHKAQGGFITDEVHRHCLSFIGTAVEVSKTYKVLKPHLSYLLGEVVLPSLCVSEDEVATFTDDPVEYIRKVHNIFDEFMDPRMQAQNVLQTLARYRPKDALPVTMTIIRAAREKCRNGSGPDATRLKDGIIVTVASIVRILLQHKDKSYTAFVDEFIANELVPLFHSGEAVLRSRACWAVEYFDKYKWGSGLVLAAVVGGLVRGLQDGALPVQAAAACSMRCMIEVDGAKDMVRPLLPQIIEQFFRIMSESENDAMMSALQAIVMQFGEEMGELAPAMIRQLLTNFSQFAAQGDDDEAQFSACQCLETVSAVLEAIEGKTEIIASLEPLLCPLIYQVLTTDSGFEYFEQILGLFFGLSPRPQKVAPAQPGTSPFSANLWMLVGPLLESLNGDAYSFMLEVRDVLFEFMNRDPATFCAPTSQHNGVAFADMVIEVVHKSLGHDDSLTEEDARTGAGMLYVMVCNARASQALSSSGVVARVLGCVIPRLLGGQPVLAPADDESAVTGAPVLLGCKTRALKVLLVEIVLACLYYNADEAVLALSADQPTFAAVVSTAFALAPSLDEPQDMRIVVMSFSSLLALGPQSSALLPAEVRSNLPSMLQFVVKELKLLRDEQCDEPAKSDDGYEKDEDWDGEDDGDGIDVDDGDDGEDNQLTAAQKRAAGPEGGYDDNQDVENAEGEAYHEYLERQANRGTRYVGGEAVDDEEGGENHIPCKADKEDVLLFFSDAIAASHASAALQAALGAEDLASLHEHLAAASERRSSAGSS